jgi:hypothetical protein
MTPIEVVALTTPLLAWSGPLSEPSEKFVAKRFVAESAVELANGNCDAATVELEKKTPSVEMLVEVAAVVVAKLFPLENIYAKLEPMSVAQPNAPFDHVRYCPAVQPPRPFAYNREVEATLEVIAVVEAYGYVTAEFAGAEASTEPL